MPSAFAAQSITDRIEIDADNIPSDIAAGDMFGYEIESIGDLDNDGVVDLAVIKFSADLLIPDDDFGSILIMFMNSDGSVKGTNEIVMDATAAGIGASCIVGDGTNRDNGSLEQLAFVGDLDPTDGEYKPILALGANSNDHPIANSGAVYMLELNSDGTVDNCVLITEDSNGFDPAIGEYRTSGEGQAAFFGWPLIATDLDGDGQNELLVGASNDADTSTNLWVLFLTTTGAVSSHPATPILGTTDIGITGGLFIDDGNTITGGTKIVVGVKNEGTTGSIFIVTLTSAGAFSSSAEIAGTSLGQGIAGSDRFGRGVAPIGDMDNDGVDDIIVGNISGDDTATNSGEAYILFMNSDDTVKESQKISNESEDARNGSTPFADGDMLGNGMTLWQTSGNTVTIAIGAHEDDTGGAGAGAIHLFYINNSVIVTDDTKKSGGSGDNKHLTRPTFGLSHSTFMPWVECGYSHNGVCYDITDNWHTDFDKVEIKTGVPQEIIIKGKFTNGVKTIGWGLIPEVGEYHKAEVKIQAHINHLDEVDHVDTYQKHNILNMTSIVYEYYQERCGFIDSKCDVLKMSNVIFNVEPKFEKIAIYAVDDQRRTHLTSLNEGYDIFGESLNEPLISHVSASKGGAFYPQDRGLVKLTLISYHEGLWQDPFGYLWKTNDYGFYIVSSVPVPQKEPDLMWSAMTRINSNFDAMKQTAIERAVLKFDSTTLQKDIKPTFTIVIMGKIDKLQDPIVLENMKIEEQKALLTLHEIFDTHK